jgi:OFA family oxalate/formate antiporter-like MFS transporter
MTVARVPTQAYVVTGAGTVVNLCLGILYAWSIWKAQLLADADHPAGTPMSGLNAGWVYLSDAEATWAYATCGFMFALCMIPGGRLQDRYGPRVGAILGGLCLAGGCMLAGWAQSFTGLIVGFGLLGGLGMGLGYAATTPAAVRWFGAHQRGLIVGIVVSGYGAAAIYIAPLARTLISQYGISGSLYALGLLFGVVICVAGCFLQRPPADYQPPTAPTRAVLPPAHDWTARAMLGTWQFYGLVLLFIGSAQAGLLTIANATRLLNQTAPTESFWALNAWLLASYGGVINALGRVGTGQYSDRLGRLNAYALNGILAAGAILLTPTVMDTGNVLGLFIVVGIVFWQYGGTLALLPACTADFYGAKHLGLNYGLVFLGWGIAFFIPQLGGYLKDLTGSLDAAFYLSGGLLLAAVALSRTLGKIKSEA